MTLKDPLFAAPLPMAAELERQTALDHLLGAWEEALLEGVDGDCLANVAIFAGLKELVAVYGEEPVAQFCERLPQRVRSGEFTLTGLPQ